MKSPALGTLCLAAISALHAAVPQFTGPEVLKLDWNTRCPRAADFDGDGLMDIALLNLDRSRVEFLLQGKDGIKPGEAGVRARHDVWNPILEVSRFTKQPFVVGRSLYSLAVGDWNGDGRADIAYTTDDKHLVIHLHGKDMADWSQKREFLLADVLNDGESLQAGDLNGDKRPDLALLTPSNLMILIQGEQGQWQEPRNYALSDDSSIGLRIADLNGDNRADILCTSGSGKSLLVRLQSPSGSFGEEWQLAMAESKNGVQPVRLGSTTAMAWLPENTGMVEVAKLEQQAIASDNHAAALHYSLPNSDAKSGAVTYADLSGDGVGDVVMAEPKRARLWVFVGRKDGSFEEGRDYPSLSGVDSLAIADVDGDRKPEVVLLSPTEKTVGISRWIANKLDYPTAIYRSEDALPTMTVGSYGKGGSPSVLVLREGKPKTSITHLHYDAKLKMHTMTDLALPSVPLKISALRVLDADQDGAGDLAIFSTTASMQIWLSREDPKKPLVKVEDLPDTLTAKLSPGAMSMANLDGDPKPELILAREQLARVFKIGPDAKAKMIQQFNAAESTAQISAALVQPRAKGNAILLIDQTTDALQEMTADAQGIYRLAQTRRLSDGAVEAASFTIGTTAQHLLLLNKQRFELLPMTGTILQLKRLSAIDSELKDAKPGDLLAAPFSTPGQDDLVLLDTRRARVAEFFRSPKPDGLDWQSYLYFRVFQSDPHYRGKAGFDDEPHDYAAMDLNGDGKADLCLLVHDRVLLYVQK
jgi:FG-GAP-like repeat